MSRGKHEMVLCALHYQKAAFDEAWIGTFGYVGRVWPWHPCCAGHAFEI